MILLRGTSFSSCSGHDVMNYEYIHTDHRYVEEVMICTYIWKYIGYQRLENYISLG